MKSNHTYCTLFCGAQEVGAKTSFVGLSYIEDPRFHDTVRMADTIAVIEHGQITESGAHDELLSRGGTYANLYTLQAENYR